MILLRIALRDLRASWQKFIFVVLAVAAGVGALTGVRSFSESFRAMLFKEARSLLAADLFVRIFAQPTAAQAAAIERLRARGVVYTPVTETVSMAMAEDASAPVLVTVKAVDPAVYPLYGQVDLNPVSKLPQVLRSDTVVASDDLLLRLNTSVGGTIQIGGQAFRIAAVLVKEPDRMSGSFGVGPRLLLSREALERTGLVSMTSRASQRMLFRTGPLTLAAVESELKREFPEALVVNFRDMNPNVSRGIQRATTFLSLVSLIALIVGAIGVATAMNAHLQTRLDSIAIMKSIGGRSPQVVSIYVVQTVLLGLAGGALGVIAGFFVQGIFPSLIERFLQIRPDIVFTPLTAAQGLCLGVLTALLFTLPPLIRIREIRPALILRRDMDDAPATWRSRLQMLIPAIAICLGLAAVAATLVGGTWNESLQIGGAFVGGLLVSLAALTVVSATLLRILRTVVTRTPGLPVTIRHAVSNLYRPGSQSRAVLIALGVGVMFTLTVYLVQRSVLDEIRRSAPPGMANVFFIDITPDQKDELLTLVSRQSGVARPPDMITTVSCRLEAVNGKPVASLGLSPGVARRYQMARNVSAEPVAPTGTEILRGKWWQAGAPPQISITQAAARLLKVDVGSTLTWNAYGKSIETQVAAVHRTDERHLRAMLEFHMNPEALAGLPTVHYASARIDAPAIGAVQRAVYQRFPTVTVINVADILDRVQEVVDQVAVVIRFISGFSIFAGAIILASSVAGTRFRRVREMAIFKTLGATRGRIARMFSAEFLILGAAAGLIGSLLATAFTWLVLRRFFEDVPFRFDPVAIAVSALLTALVASASGWLASFRILGQKPLEVLRGE